jgi:hypothetical protein
MSSKPSKQTTKKKTASKPTKPVNKASPLGTKKKTTTKPSASTTTKPAENNPDPKKNEKAPPVRVQRETKHLKCELTVDEYQDRTQQAAQAWVEKSRLEEQLKSVKDDFKGKISTYEAQHAALQSEILNRCTYRDVDCERVFDYAKKVVYLIRLDTKQEVERRAITSAEAQTTMPWGGSKPTDTTPAALTTKEHKGPLTAPLAEIAKVDPKTQQELKEKAADRMASNGIEDRSKSESTTQKLEDAVENDVDELDDEFDDDDDDDDDDES